MLVNSSGDIIATKNLPSDINILPRNGSNKLDLGHIRFGNNNTNSNEIVIGSCDNNFRIYSFNKSNTYKSFNWNSENGSLSTSGSIADGKGNILENKLDKDMNYYDSTDTDDIKAVLNEKINIARSKGNGIHLLGGGHYHRSYGIFICVNTNNNKSSLLVFFTSKTIYLYTRDDVNKTVYLNKINGVNML